MRRTTAMAALALGGAALLAGCGSEVEQRAKGKVADAADRIAEIGAGAAAKGRWRCETDQVEHGRRSHLTTLVAIGEDGRFTWERRGEGADGPQVGTWEVDGLRLRLEVPWDDDGANGFVGWEYDADTDPPGHLRGEAPERGTRQELDITFEDADEVHLVQPDDGEEGPTDLDYSWDTTCTRTSSDPGTIPPTVPASTGGD